MFKMDEYGFSCYDKRDYEDAQWAVGYCNHAGSEHLDSRMKLNFISEKADLYDFSGDVKDMIYLIPPISLIKQCLISY